MTPRPNPLIPADEAALRAAIEQEGLAEWADDIVAVAEHGIQLKAVDAAASSAFSRSGVLPSVPPGFTWPTLEPYEDEHPFPLALVAQVDLAELAAQDVNNLLPPTGLLYFFHPNGEDAYGDVLQVAVRHFPDATPADTAPYDMALLPGAADYQEEWHEPPYAFQRPVAYEPAGRGKVPRHLHLELGIQGRELDDEDVYRVYDATRALDDAFGPSGEVSMLGPDDDFDIDLKASAAALDTGEGEVSRSDGVLRLNGAREYRDASGAARAVRDEWRVLLDMGATDATGCPMYFLIRDDALAAGDFSNVVGASVQW
ncbi:DUF1963 domain-containing protein [Streptomyces sp. NPDC087440]|uniref:DUF1963 domain-containing protein n=1 Tax=Streptomyces sp. NPDC087440 TaxID=3365790 RepID=UPI0037FEB1D1